MQDLNPPAADHDANLTNQKPAKKPWHAPQCTKKNWQTPQVVAIDFARTGGGPVSSFPESENGTPLS